MNPVHVVVAANTRSVAVATAEPASQNKRRLQFDEAKAGGAHF